MSAFRLFTSYAHADTSDHGALRTFYFDLATELQSMGIAQGEFLDAKDIPTGADWRRTLERGLSSTMCLLAFYSPTYFGRPDCGREVRAFQLRLERFQNDLQNPDRATVPPLIIGVLWQTENLIRDLIPPSLSRVQYGVPHFQEEPLKRDQAALNRSLELRDIEVKYGLRYIMRMKDAMREYQAAYEDIVTRYASHIAYVTKGYDLSKYPFEGDYQSLTPAFPKEYSATEAVVPTRGTYGTGPKFVRVLFLVGAPNALQNLADRQNRDAYADDPRLWKPFWPDSEDDIGTIVQSALISEKMIPEWVLSSPDLDRNTLVQIVEKAAKDNNVLLVVIDPWSVFLPNLQLNLKELDRRRNAYGSMFVCWNDGDPDTSRKASELQQELQDAFEETIIDNQSWLTEITFRTPQTLRDQLAAKIYIIKKRILDRLAKEGQIRRLPPGTSMPTATVPSR